MHLFLTALALVFVTLGFFGLVLGGLPTVLFWFLAGVCLMGAWKAWSTRRRHREEQPMRPPTG